MFKRSTASWLVAMSRRTNRAQFPGRKLSMEPLESRNLLAITVDSIIDEMDGSIQDGDISLRDALSAASSGEIIDFDINLSGQTISLQLGELPVARSLSIHGLGAGQLTISAGSSSRVFLIDDGDSGTQVGVELSGLTLTEGTAANAPSFTGRGGAIYSRENLTLRDVEITSSTAPDVGGGIAALGPLTVIGSTIAHNSANTGGGGIWVGGVGTTISSSAIVGNAATMGGGMLVSVDAITRVTNSTFSGNEADQGGGMFLLVGDLELAHSTITANQATTSGGGVATTDFISHVDIDHTILAGNHAGAAADLDFDFPLMQQTTNFSLIGDNEGTVLTEAPIGIPDTNGNLVGDAGGAGIITPGLVGLADNGGATRTHALMPNSPALDAGDPLVVGGHGATPQFDQRGAPFNRVVDGDGDGVERVDMGAFESQRFLECDLDADSDCDVADLDALIAVIAAGGTAPQFDLTGDGLVDLHDRDAWLAIAGEHNLGKGRVYLLGDANLDGVVDGLDFLRWNAHKFSHVAAWSAGDFNADGIVDGLDFVIWNAHKFRGQPNDSDADDRPPRRSPADLLR